MAVGIMLRVDRVEMVSRRRWLWWCLIHRADDPSFDASVAWAHWASTLRSGTVRAAVGSLLTLLSVVGASTDVRCAGSRRLAGAEICRLDPTTVLIDGFPGAARRTAATYVLTNTHRPTPSGRSVQNHRDTASPALRFADLDPMAT